MTAAEALRKARATMDCNSAPVTRDHPWVDDCAGNWDTADFPFGWHMPMASALLDGFTVEELTEAGG